MTRKKGEFKLWKCNYLIILCLIIYIISNSGINVIGKSAENICFGITKWTIKRQYILSGYCQEGENKKNIIEVPFDLAYQYTEKNRTQIDGFDYSEYTEETVNTNVNKSRDEEKTTEEQTEKSMPAETQPPQETTVAQNSISTESLTFDYLMKNYYTVVAATTVYPSDLDASKLMSYDMKMKQDNSCPQILIYHTHGQEGFVDSTPNDPSTGIIGVGDYLTSILVNQYGYNVIHVSESFDYINGVLDRSKAYDYAYNRISQVLADNPSIEVVLDLHRDGVNENLHLVTDINGKQTAKIMFFNGMSRLASTGEIDYLYNPNREMNLAMSLQMKVKAMEIYPDFTRKNYIQAYEYNQQVRPKSMLIEAGAQTNTLQEEKNAMEPLADLLNKILQ